MSENFIEEWFLFPMQPTPNARLHLGHIAGPYLSSDVIRRWAILNYKKAYVACGTDVWENWVLEAARIEKKDVYNYVTNMDSLIREDLSLINIEIDFWINPLDSKFNNEYQTFHENLLKNLIVSNKVKLIKDIALFNNNNEISTGFSISGFCPSCNLNIRGNSCTNCGLGILPHEIKYPVEFKTNLKLIPKTLEVYYTNLKIKTKELLKTFYGFNDEVSFYFKNQTKILGLNIRITEPGVWGIESNIAPPNTVIRNSYYFYCIFLGLVISKILKKKHNIFSKKSQNRKIALFGIDNASVGITSSLVLSKVTNFNFFDSIVMNQMLLLDEKKFSKSKCHGIWVKPLVNKIGASSDELRFMLSSFNLSNKKYNLTPLEIKKSIEFFRNFRHHVLEKAFLKCSSIPQKSIIEEGRIDIMKQSQFFNRTNPDLFLSFKVSLRWIDKLKVGNEPDEINAILQVLCFLIYPFVPITACEIFECLGLGKKLKLDLLGVDCSKLKKWKKSDSVNTTINLSDIEDCIGKVN